MSRIFKRPMFRKGGNVGNGIMTGIVDRSNYQQGTIPTVEQMTKENIETLLEAAGPSQAYDPLTTFLLQYGPAAAAQTGGGTFSNLVAAAAKPTETLIQQKQKEADFLRGLKTQAAGTAIQRRAALEDVAASRAFEAEEAEKGRFFQEKMSDKDFENRMAIVKDEQAFLKLTEEDRRRYEDRVRKDAEKVAKMTRDEEMAFRKELAESDQNFRLGLLDRELESKMELKELDRSIVSDAEKAADIKDLAKEYDGSTVKAENRYEYEKNRLESKMQSNFGKLNGGLIGDFHGDFAKTVKNNNNVGKVYYDVTDGKVKRVTRNNGQPGFEIIDLETYTPDESTSSAIQDSAREVLPESGLFNRETNPGFGEVKESGKLDPFIN